MKKNSRIFLLCYFLALWCFLGAQDYCVVTYNIRFDNPSDKPHVWSARLPLIIDQLNKWDPEFIGFQEVLHNQLLDLSRHLPEYEYTGVGRDDGKKGGEYAPIFYKSSLYSLIDKGTFWLSDTPEVPSVGWDAVLPRIATWILIVENKTGDTILVVNTHFDHVGSNARLQSTKLIAKFVEEAKIEGSRVIVLGDFNTSSKDEPYQWLRQLTDLQDAFEKAAIRTGPEGTFNSFLFDFKSPRIDFVFLDPGFQVMEYHVLKEQVDGILPSDHWPVIVRFRYL